MGRVRVIRRSLDEPLERLASFLVLVEEEPRVAQAEPGVGDLGVGGLGRYFDLHRPEETARIPRPRGRIAASGKSPLAKLSPSATGRGRR